MKKTVYDIIFKKMYDGDDVDIPFGDLPDELEPTDLIEYESDPGFYSDNNSWDPYTSIIIRRPRLETDEEYEKRLDELREFKENSKKERRIRYLKLKEEFEPSDKKD